MGGVPDAGSRWHLACPSCSHTGRRLTDKPVPSLTFRRSQECVRTSRVLISQSLELISCSRRTLDPSFAVSGGSDDSERTLRATARALLASGLLRPTDGKCWSGPSTEKSCVVCGEPIMPGQLQVEPDDGDAVQFVAHVPCFLAWCHESHALDQ